MNSPDPMPRDFGWRYIGWLAWKNAITVLSTIQIAFGTLLLAADGDPAHPLIPHGVVRWIIVANAVLTAVLAQIKRDAPPPTKLLSTPQEGKP